MVEVLIEVEVLEVDIEVLLVEVVVGGAVVVLVLVEDVDRLVLALVLLVE